MFPERPSLQSDKNTTKELTVTLPGPAKDYAGRTAAMTTQREEPFSGQADNQLPYHYGVPARDTTTVSPLGRQDYAASEASHVLLSSAAANLSLIHI